MFWKSYKHIALINKIIKSSQPSMLNKDDQVKIEMEKYELHIRNTK